MEDLTKRLELAALLHDIGKLVLRAERFKKTHSKAGAEFLQQFAGPDNNDIIRAVLYHHARDIPDDLPPSDISYIVCEADNIAAGSDRRSTPSGSGQGFSAKMPLSSIFNAFSGKPSDKSQFFYLRTLRNDTVQYPHPKEKVCADSNSYNKLYSNIKDNFKKKSPFLMETNELLYILEAICSYIPSSTSLAEVSDISLYDHLRLTAAYAAAMYQYFEESGITDYRSATSSKQAKIYRSQPMYLLASGDISGIQKFIYSIPSKGALKSLRGRSLYLEVLLEHIVDEILAELSLSRASLIYTGGGHFYLLLPNTQKAKTVLEKAKGTINDWLMHHFADRLYLALAWTPCTADEFMGEGTRDVFSRVSKGLSQEKRCRYSLEQLENLFNPENSINKVADAFRECSICRTSAANLLPYPGSEETLACPACTGLFKLGESALKGNIFCILKQPEKYAVPLPGLGGRSYYLAVKDTDKAEAMRNDFLRRIYVKNENLASGLLATHLWMGDYIAYDEDGKLMDFEDLAHSSAGLIKGRGIERIGVLRADVDNLGAAFLAGFDKKYATLTRSAVLSRQLALFFKHYINKLCRSEVNGEGEYGYKSFSLFGNSGGKKTRDIHIIYSGGDDLFLVGAWQDIIELAVDLYHAFYRFSSGKLHFSAGIGFFQCKHPISDMARLTGNLESMAKSMPGKNSVSLFGMHDDDFHANAYTWPVFIDRVCGEKLQFLQEHFSFDDSDDGRLPVGKSALYRILNLLTSKGSIQLARFAYALARLSPKGQMQEDAKKHYDEIRKTFYHWYSNAEDRQEFLTAIELIIYGLREKGESDDD